MSTDIFLITIGVYDNTGTYLENSVSQYTVIISLSSGVLSGISSMQSTNGIAEFSNLRILSDGYFTITATSVGIVSVTSSYLPITNFLYSITATASPSSVSTNFNTVITVSLKGEDNNPFNQTSTVTISQNNDLVGALSDITSSGTATFTVYFTKSGSKSLTISSGSKTTSLSVNVLQNKIKIISISPLNVISIKLLTSLNVFSLNIQVTDNPGVTLSSANGVYPILLTLSSSGVLSGINSLSTTSGEVTFSNLRILSQGTFTIAASSNDLISDITQSLPIINYVYYVIIEAETLNPSINFYFTITVTIKGEDNKLFLSSSTISLSADNGNIILGNTSMATSTGSAILSIYFSSIGTKIITATCSGISNTTTVIVVNEVLKINSIAPIVMYMQPSTSRDVFSINIGVYDSTSSVLETIQNYEITLALTNDGILFGITTILTNGGLAVFNGLRILSAGNLAIIASSGNIASIYSSSMIITNYVYTIDISSTNSSPSVNSIFTITVTLKGEDNNAFTGNSAITLSTSPINSGLAFESSSLSTITTTTGIATFSIYFSSSGSKAIIASCNSITETLSLNVLEQILKIISTNPIVIYK